MTSKIEVDKTDLFKLEVTLAGIKNGVPRVLSNSINKTIKTTQVQAVKLIGQDLNLPAKRIKKDFKQDKANFSKLKGGLIAAGEPVGLINFAARQVKAGVSHKVKRVSARSTTRHAFIAARGTKSHVFWRAYDGPRKPAMPGRNYAAMPKMYTHPIHIREGPRIEDVYGDRKMYDKVEKIAADTYVKNVGIETGSLLRRFG